MSRVARAVAVRPGEARQALLVAGAFAAVEAGRGIGEVGVDTLILTRFGAEVFPFLYVGLGVVGSVVTLSYSTALTRSSSPRFFPAILALLASILAGQWLIALAGIDAILPVVWISVYAAGVLLLTVIWTVGSFTFDVRQAKRLFPLLTSAAIVGSLSGFLAAIPVQRLAGAESLIIAEALLFGAAAFLLAGLGPRLRPRRAPGEPAPPLRVAATAGAAYVARSPLMRLVAVAYVLLAILLFSLTFPFMTVMNEAFPEESALLTVLALFSGAVTAISFLVGALLANRLLARVGVATVALALPLVYLMGFGLWIARFTLATAVIVRFVQQVTQRGLSNAAFGAFYSLVPSRDRGQVLAFMDGVPGQLGTITGGLLLIVASRLALEQVFHMGLITAVVAVVVLLLIRRAYASSLVATLREGHAERVLEGGPGLAAMRRDARVIEELLAATSDGRPQQRLLAVALLGRLGARDAIPAIRRRCDDEHAGVRAAALTALARLDASAAADAAVRAVRDEDAEVRVAAVMSLRASGGAERLDGELLRRLGDDESASVRREFAVLLAARGGADRAQALIDRLLASADSREREAGLDAIARTGHGIDGRRALRWLGDGSPYVRAAALRAAAAHADVDVDSLVGAFDDDARLVRGTAAAIAGSRPDTGPRLIGLLGDGTDRVQEAALTALADHAADVRDELFSWADQQVRRASESRVHGSVLASADRGSTAAYLGEVIGRREIAIEARLLQALTILGAPEASGLIRRCLRAPDPEVRAQAIEALDALGDARLARRVVRLLDQEVDGPDAVSADIVTAATTLSGDRDPWVRALALRTLSEHDRATRHEIARRAGEDPHPFVRASVGIEEEVESTPGTPRLMSDIERMLALRRVPLFEPLDPEDLQRVAATASERSWAEGDELMVEGELGNELIVIITGSVRVVRAVGDVEHPLRTYGEGDHIGELAVLREAPRAATVIAAEPVRGLVIAGEAVQALLWERPEVSMAMLATLAERISQET